AKPAVSPGCADFLPALSQPAKHKIAKAVSAKVLICIIYDLVDVLKFSSLMVLNPNLGIERLRELLPSGVFSSSSFSVKSPFSSTNAASAAVPSKTSEDVVSV